MNIPRECLLRVIKASAEFFLALILVSASDREKTVYEQAAAQMEEGHPQAALALLQPWIETRPHDLRALTLLGMATAASGKLEDANSFFERALRINPSYAPALKGLGMNEMNLQRPDAARAHFEHLLAISPRDPVAHAALGEIAFARQDFSRVMEHFEQAGSLSRRNPRLVLEFARAGIATKQSVKASALLGDMPDEAEGQAHFEAGVLLASLKSYKSAARQFDLALPGYPDQYLVGFNLVLARVKCGEYQAAATEGEKLISAGHRKAELYNLVAEAYEKAGDTKHAYDSLRIATQIEPFDEANYVDLITLCIDHKNYDLASEIAGVALTRLPSSERIHLQLGVVFAMKEEFEQAQKEFERAETLSPNRSLPHIALALTMMQMNRPEDAVQRLRDRVHQSPDDYLALWYLGEALNRSGTVQGSPEAQEAISSLQRSVQLNPEISQSHELLGKFLSREGQLDKAADQLEIAVRLDPENEAATYQLAQVYRRKGDLNRSKPLFAKLSKMKAEERENFANRRLQQLIRAEAPK